MTATISKDQALIVLQYLYSEHARERCHAIREMIAQRWQNADLIYALTELAVLDEAPKVRTAARFALRELEQFCEMEQS